MLTFLPVIMSYSVLPKFHSRRLSLEVWRRTSVALGRMLDFEGFEKAYDNSDFDLGSIPRVTYQAVLGQVLDNFYGRRNVWRDVEGQAVRRP